MSKSLGNDIGVTEAAVGDLRAHPVGPPRPPALEVWYSLLLGASPPSGVSPRATRSAPSRAPW